MKHRDVEWSQKRRDSSRTLAFWFEAQGLEWTSIREAVNEVAPILEVETAKKRRSAIAIECHEILILKGFAPGPNYVPPWLRDGGIVPNLRRSRRPTDPKLLAFYDSFDWKRLRFEVLCERGRTCDCCGVDSRSAMIHVDHIKPLRKRWDLRLQKSNLQVLCEDCNMGKGSQFETDFRGPAVTK